MRKTIELKNVIENLFCCVELRSFAEDILEHLNSEDLLQAIWNYAVPVYAYTVWTEDVSDCEYRGDLLFPFSATLLYSMPSMISTSESGIICERHVELWLTDDMKLVVVSNYCTDFYDGEFVSKYRTIKTTDQDEFSRFLDLDYNLLALVLAALADEYAHSPMTTYEL